MNYSNKSKEDLIKELVELKRTFSDVTRQYDNELSLLRLAEEEVRKSEEKFRKAFTRSPDSININRLEDGMYTSINDGFTKIMGYAEEEVIGKTSLELNIWKDPEDRRRLVETIQSAEEMDNLEASFIAKDGSIKYGLMSAAKIIISGVPHIISITRDITDKKNAAVALQHSENRYRELIELAVDGILLGAQDGTIIGANSYMLQISGRHLDQLIGMNISELFQSDDLKNVPLRFDLLQSGKTVIYERQIVRPDGKKIPIEMHSKMMPDGTYQSIFHDITDRREAEHALRESEEWFRNLFEQSSDGILYLSDDGNIVTVNKSFAEMHGYTQDEIMKKNIMELDCPETRSFYNERMLRLRNRENLKFEVEHFHKDGYRIPLEVTASMITMGSKDYIMAAHRDISERLKVEEVIRIARDKAEASDRLKTSFLNNISHEVRTPLNGILGFAQIISKEDLSPSEKQEALLMVHESSERLLETITNYMDTSLMVSGAMTVKNSEFYPESCFRNLLKKFKPICLSKGIELTLNLPEQSDRYVINSDQELLQKIYTQLLNNSIKFTEKGYIHFGYSKQDSHFEFFVSDTGIGIGEKSLNNVFDHFVKEEQIKNRKSEGSGLGLSISKGMVNLLGGELRVESEKGKGSKFFFTLPFIGKAEEKSVESGSENLNKRMRLSSILVAEDDETNFLYIKTLLGRSTSAEIIRAANGREAIEKFSSNPGIDLVLMDIKMPEIDGFEATRQIKLLNRNTPVIAITAYAMSGDADRVLAAGCDGYLSKPISKKNLLEKISEFVKI